jgi:hypothetical protein
MAKNAKKDNAENQKTVDTSANEQPKKHKDVNQTLVSGGQFHPFDTEPVFEGVYTGNNALAQKDDLTQENGRKAGDVIGYIFEDEEGNEVIVGRNHSTEKAMQQVEKLEKPVMRFEFLGKVQMKGGKPFNRFKIDLLGYQE